MEYDALGDAYAEFLLSEILPPIRARFAVTDDPEQWAIGGMSSGGICAFTVAWERPDRFRRVLSFLGSFVDIRGGDRYPELIATSPSKPLRVFLQTGTRDTASAGDGLNSFSANLKLAAALSDRATICA